MTGAPPHKPGDSQVARSPPQVEGGLSARVRRWPGLVPVHAPALRAVVLATYVSSSVPQPAGWVGLGFPRLALSGRRAMFKVHDWGQYQTDTPTRLGGTDEARLPQIRLSGGSAAVECGHRSARTGAFGT